MANNDDFKQGQKDAADGKGQRDPNSFKNDDERKQYQAGWNKGQQDGKK